MIARGFCHDCMQLCGRYFWRCDECRARHTAKVVEALRGEWSTLEPSERREILRVLADAGWGIRELDLTVESE